MEPPTVPRRVRERSAPRAGHDPGLVVVFSAGVAGARVLPLELGRLELGRTDGSPGQLDDGRVSRCHALVERDGKRWVVTDLGSQNGTFVDGHRVLPRAPTPVGRVVRAGDTLLVPCDDVRPYERAGMRTIDGAFRGPAMQLAIAEAERAGRNGATLHLRGEVGTGKHGVARVFHRAARRGGHPLVAVDCAALRDDIADILAEADRGTLFLDEIAALDLDVQAHLAQALASRTVDIALCVTSSRDLRAWVAAGVLRDDLYARITTPVVTLPPLRDRPEEIPALIAHELHRHVPAEPPHVSLVEQCLLRPWPGNVRELRAAVRAAAQAALDDSAEVSGGHLAPSAGLAAADNDVM